MAEGRRRPEGSTLTTNTAIRLRSTQTHGRPASAFGRFALPLALVAALGAAGCDDADEADERPDAVATAPPRPSAPAADVDRVGTPAAPARPAATLPANAQATAGQAGTEKVGIPAAGMGSPIAAITADIPAGWKTRGGIAWNERSRCMATGLRFEWSATSPDGTQAVELIPGFSWQLRGNALQMNPCPVAPIGSAEQYLRAVAAELYPGATVTGYVDLTSQLAAPPPPTVPNMVARNEAGRIELAYALDGRKVRETLQTLVGFTDLAANGFVSKMGLASYVLVVRGTADRFDDTLGDRVSKSLVPNRDWFQAVSERGRQIIEAQSAEQRAEISRWHNQRMAEISAKGAADRHAIRMNTIREVGQINTAGWKSRQASLDRQHRGAIDSIREVSRYADTSTGRVVELSNHYNHGFRTSSGAYVATDDPNFNPGSGGVEMNRVR